MPSNDSIYGIAGLFAGRWWALVLRGLVAIAFGVLAFFLPGITVATLVLLFGCYAFVDGVFMLMAAIGRQPHPHDRWLLALEGIVGMWAGVVTLRAPGITAFVLVFLISFWAMATGFLRIAAAVRLRKEISGEVWLAMSGVVAILFALLLMVRPGLGAITLVWMIAGYALIAGIVMIVLGFELRRPREAW